MVETKTTTYYTPPVNTKMQFLTPTKQVVRDHKDAIEKQKEKLEDIITEIIMLEMNNTTV
jgi:hypothetical protein